MIMSFDYQWCMAAYEMCHEGAAFSEADQKTQDVVAPRFAQMSAVGSAGLNSKFVTIEGKTIRKATVWEVLVHFFQNLIGRRDISTEAVGAFEELLKTDAFKDVTLETLKAEIDALLAGGANRKELLKQLTEMHTVLDGDSFTEVDNIETYVEIAEKLKAYLLVDKETCLGDILGAVTVSEEPDIRSDTFARCKNVGEGSNIVAKAFQDDCIQGVFWNNLTLNGTTLESAGDLSVLKGFVDENLGGDPSWFLMLQTFALTQDGILGFAAEKAAVSKHGASLEYFEENAFQNPPKAGVKVTVAKLEDGSVNVGIKMPLYLKAGVHGALLEKLEGQVTYTFAKEGDVVALTHQQSSLSKA